MDATLSLGLPRLNRSGTLLEGIALWGELKPLLTAEAVMERALRYCDLAVSQGLLSIRTHVDVCDPRLLAVDALLDEPRARIAPEQFARLMQLLWESLDDEYMGFGRQRSKRGTFAMMCYAIIHCHSLEKALGRGALFYSLFPEAPAISIQRDGSGPSFQASQARQPSAAMAPTAHHSGNRVR